MRPEKCQAESVINPRRTLRQAGAQCAIPVMGKGHKKASARKGGGPSCGDGREKRQRVSGRGQAGQGRKMLGDPAGTLLGRLLAGVTAQGGVVVVEGLALIKNVGQGLPRGDG